MSPTMSLKVLGYSRERGEDVLDFASGEVVEAHYFVSALKESFAQV